MFCFVVSPLHYRFGETGDKICSGPIFSQISHYSGKQKTKVHWRCPRDSSTGNPRKSAQSKLCAKEHHSSGCWTFAKSLNPQNLTTRNWQWKTSLRQNGRKTIFVKVSAIGKIIAVRAFKLNWGSHQQHASLLFWDSIVLPPKDFGKKIKCTFGERSFFDDFMQNWMFFRKFQHSKTYT